MKNRSNILFVQLTALMMACALLFSVFGPHVIFSIQKTNVRKEIKKKIKQGVPDSELRKFALDELKGNISWTEGKREFKLNGEMYDVVKTEVRNGKMYFYCISDTQETALFKKLDELTDQELQKKNQALKNKPVFHLFFNQHPPVCFSVENPSQTLCGHKDYLPAQKDVLSPPPKI